MPEILLCKDAYHASEGADVLVIVTEWNEFRALELGRVKKLLKRPRLVDLRNIYDPESVRKNGFEYWGIGRR
jgi:UDPglucose 6-dehydrogenase